MAEQRAFVGYGDGVEQRASDEDETIGRIIASMTRESQTTTERYGRAVRASHAKSTGLCNGASGVKPVVRCLATGVWLLSVVGAAAAHKMLSEGAGEPI